MSSLSKKEFGVISLFFLRSPGFGGVDGVERTPLKLGQVVDGHQDDDFAGVVHAVLPVGIRIPFRVTEQFRWKKNLY